MQSSQTPTLMPLPFASGGGKNTIPEASQLPGNPGGASYTDGFPPATRTPIVAGGIPPAGLDMNGILFAITQISRWSNAGGLYAFNSTFAADVNVGGYPAGAELMSADLQGSWISLNDNNTDNPDTGAGTKWVPGRTYGITAVAGLTNANVTLTPAQAAKNKVTLAGTLTGNVQIIFPTWLKTWEVVNNTTGSFSVTCKTASGTGVTVQQGGVLSRIACDGTNIVQLNEQMNVAPASTATNPVQMGQVQTQAGTAFTTAGTAPNFTLTPAPAIGAYAANQRFRVSFNAAGTTGSNTLNISGQGAKNLMQYGPDGVLVPAVITNGLLTDIEYNGTSMVVLDPVAAGFSAVQPISASVASNALTLTLNPTALSFRSATLGNGATTALSIGTALSLTVPSGATLGTVNATQATLAIAVAYNAGTPVLCVANIAGSVDLTETSLISPTTISGSANSVGVWYSASAVAANSPYRVVGYVNATEATAGTWATAPSLVQGSGGQALTGIQGFGIGQTMQNVTGSRAIGTTYTNTTGKPIAIYVTMTVNAGQSGNISVNGSGVVALSNVGTSATSVSGTVIVPPGATYSTTLSGGSLSAWFENR